MAGLIKNQLVKRLASFTKGLSVEKIDLDILSGRGYLDNLELDEQFMTSVLELPVWMSFTKILCSKIRLKVSFTKLKSEPIRIFIDTVYVEANIGKQTKRSEINVEQKLADAGLSNSGSTSYGYIEQVIDGMHISVSTIRLTLTSKHHLVTTELSGVELVSTNRKWKSDDLRKTRAYVNPGREEVLVYKMLTVNHAKFEFFDKTSQEDMSVPPLKFNFNMIHLLITMKKLVSTNEVLSACLKLVLDDILLVFTPSQLQILLAFSKELSEVVELSAPPQQHAATTTTPVKASQLSQKSFLQRFSRQHQEEDNDETDIEVVSDNVVETSYHLKTGTIDLLFCDDESTANAGSLQFRFEVVQIDLFPHRTGNASRKHWLVPSQYVKDAQLYAAEMLGDFAETQGSGVNALQNLYEMVVVLRCEHFQLLPVMGAHKRRILGPMLFSDKTKFGLSDTEPALVTTIVTYYSDKSESVVPPQNVYVHLNPTEINLDIATIWWCREFVAVTMTEDFKSMLTEFSKEDSQSDGKLKIVLILPHITIPLTDDSVDQITDQITGLQFWFSKLTISNLTNGLYLPLLSHLQECLENPVFYEDFGFPNKPSEDESLPRFKNAHLLPDIIEKLCKQDKLRQKLIEEKLKQRSPRHQTSSGTSTATSPTSVGYHTPVTSPTSHNTSPEHPDTPDGHSRRSSMSSININYADTLPQSPLRDISELFPELDKLVLGFSFESFSADFLYATDPGSGEKYRSRKFVSDVPLQMWLIERPVSAEKSRDMASLPRDKSSLPRDTAHRKLCRNSLKRQETLTSLLPSVPTDYLLLLKAHKSVSCTVDRTQYLFLLRLQQEIQSFVEKIILSVTQIFTSNVQENACFTLLTMLDHVMIDVSLPKPVPVPMETPSLPDTASTSLSHLSSPSFSSRHSVCEDEIVLVENEKSVSDKLNWVALSRSDSNIASLSERLSQHSDQDDNMSLSSITNELNPVAKGDSKETLLKFIMRVNKKHESKSVACQTTTATNIVANNYQQLHDRHCIRTATSLDDLVRKSRSHCGNLIQIHCGGSSVVVHSLRDVTTKIIVQKVVVTDDPDQIETKARCFPFLKWRGKDSILHNDILSRGGILRDNDLISRDKRQVPTPQLTCRIDLREVAEEVGSVSTLHHKHSCGELLRQSDNDLIGGDNDVILLNNEVFPQNDDDTTTSLCDLEPQLVSQLTTNVIVSNLVTHFKDSTLEGLGAFFEPDPSIKTEPMTLNCNVRNCDVCLDLSGNFQKLHIPSMKVKLCLDETWEIGSDDVIDRMYKNSGDVTDRMYKNSGDVTDRTDDVTDELQREVEVLRRENEDLKRILKMSGLKL